MGNRAFTVYTNGTNLYDAFDEVCQKALKEHGSDKFAGTIAHTSLADEPLICSFDKYKVYNEGKAMKLISDCQGGDVGVTRVVDLGRVGYAITTLYKMEDKYSAKYITKFALADEEDCILQPIEKNTFDDKKEAIEQAITLSLKEKRTVKVIKTKIKVSGNETIVEFSNSTKFQKTFSRSKYPISPYVRVEEVRKYLFFGKART